MSRRLPADSRDDCGAGSIPSRPPPSPTRRRVHSVEVDEVSGTRPRQKRREGAPDPWLYFAHEAAPLLATIGTGKDYMGTLAVRRPSRYVCATWLGILGMIAAQSGLATQADKSEEIGALFAAVSQVQSPGASVIAIQNGKVLHKEGYGLANLEHDVPNTPQTKFRLGSVTKSFTATAILMLHEQGLLSIDDPAEMYLPDFPGSKRTTVRHLLTHTSGLSEC